MIAKYGRHPPPPGGMAWRRRSLRCVFRVFPVDFFYPRISSTQISARVSCLSFLVFFLFLPFPFRLSPSLSFHPPSLLSYFFYLVYMILTSSGSYPARAHPSITPVSPSRLGARGGEAAQTLVCAGVSNTQLVLCSRDVPP
ncbi:hypothetical protein B0H19DRAFT_1136751 [Mycena capillaripes]|nr:hypothetical protein B0H19DRAFT_1136751 [Mycena capillaripes]